jgi:hypothetical protein
MQQTYRLAIRQLAPVLIAALLIYLFGLSPRLVEQLYSNGIYPVIAITLRALSRLFPFPLGDVLYLLLIGFVLWKAVLLIRKAFQRKLLKADRIHIPASILQFILILYIAFKVLWGLNYSRVPINKRLGIGEEKYSNTELLSLAEYLIRDINDIQMKRASFKNRFYTTPQLQSTAVASYKQLSIKNDFFRYPQPVVKDVLNSWFITKVGLEGYYSPLSAEANVNRRIPPANHPFVTCHEIAHQLGIGREDEANLIGYLAASNSPDLNFKYSADYAVLKNVLFEVRMKMPERYEKLINTLNAGTRTDFKKDRDFWMSYDSDMYLYMEVAFDKFLKLNNQDKGIDSYQDIVIWLFNIHKKKIFKQ